MKRNYLKRQIFSKGFKASFYNCYICYSESYSFFNKYIFKQPIRKKLVAEQISITGVHNEAKHHF